MVPVTSLPDLILLSIFRKLSPKDQLNASQAYPNWASLMPEAARVSSLALLVGSQSLISYEHRINRYSVQAQRCMQHLLNDDGKPALPSTRLTQWNSLQFDQLDEDIVKRIACIFGRVTNLQLVIYGAPLQLKHLVTLLEKWSNQLVTFKFFEVLNDDVPDVQTDHVFAAINELSTLKNLVFHLYRLPYRDLLILGQLEKFAFYPYRVSQSRSALKSLERYVTSESPLRIETVCVSELLGRLYSESDQIRRRFHQLNMYTHFSQAATISANFRSLTFLAIHFTVFNFRHLAELTQLIYLDLKVDLPSLKFQISQYRHEGTPLTSVKALKLRLDFMNTHVELPLSMLGLLLPNVQVIEIVIGFRCKCLLCSLDFDDDDRRAKQDQFKQCARQMLHSLKNNFAQLREILHSEEKILGTVEELLAE